MGILRLGIIAAVGVALLPSDSEQQEILYNRAALAAQWTLTFCDRNVQTCATATGMWGEFRKKAQFGARLAYDTISEQIASSTPSDAGAAAQAGSSPSNTRPLETGTLRPADLQPDWRGTRNRAGNKTSGRLDAKGG